MTQDLSSRLRQRITIEEPTLTPGDGGSFSVAWDMLAECWAEVMPISGAGEVVESEQLQTAERFRITLRYRADVTTSMRVVYGARILHIRSVTNDGEGCETLILITETIRS